MVEMVIEPFIEIEPPDVSHLVTEDDAPVDNIPSEKQQRLLVEPLYSSWLSHMPFLAAANVAIYSSVSKPALVPDVFLSLDVQVADDFWAKEHRSYFVWEFGKPPDVVIEIVSNTKGGEASVKVREYARLGIPYYAIYDPQRFVQRADLAVYELRGGVYIPKRDASFRAVDLGLTLWQGVFEGKQDTWLRWCDLQGIVIPTGAERAEGERMRAEGEWMRAEREYQRAERLAAKLRELGVDYDV